MPRGNFPRSGLAAFGADLITIAAGGLASVRERERRFVPFAIPPAETPITAEQEASYASYHEDRRPDHARRSASMSGEVSDILERVRGFVAESCIPAESAALAHDIPALDATIAVLRDGAQAAGLYAPQVPTALGGLGLSWEACAAIFEEAGRSLLGPAALNCARRISRTSCCSTPVPRPRSGNVICYHWPPAVCVPASP